MDPLAAFRLDGRVAYIAGGGGAIGAAIAEGFGAAGARIAIAGRSVEHAEEAGRRVAATGAEHLAMAADLLTMFVALEVMSIAIYALFAFRRDQERSAEAAFKYLVLGALSSALFLYGSALLFALVHIVGGTPLAVAQVFLLGLVLASVYVRTRSLATTIGLHGAFNLASVLALFLVK